MLNKIAFALGLLFIVNVEAVTVKTHDGETDAAGTAQDNVNCMDGL